MTGKVNQLRNGLVLTGNPKSSLRPVIPKEEAIRVTGRKRMVLRTACIVQNENPSTFEIGDGLSQTS